MNFEGLYIDTTKVLQLQVDCFYICEDGLPIY